MTGPRYQLSGVLSATWIWVQEKGEIFFFYRPKVDKDEARGPDDVQRMYIVLRPESAAVEEKQAPDSGKEGRKHRRHQGDGNGGGSGGGAASDKEQGHEGGHGKEVCLRQFHIHMHGWNTPPLSWYVNPQPGGVVHPSKSKG